MNALKKLLLFLACLYASLVILSVAVFHLPWKLLELFPEAKRDQIISSGIVSATVHPLYRDWLLNFVRTPNVPRNTDYIMDTYAAYGEIIHTTVDDDASDFLGWPNTIRPHDAQVLFVGDSFCNGASVGTRLSPPAVYARLTGAKVYNASNGGYGLGQYVRIIDKLTAGLPPEERFAGKDVVVQVYLGNDLTSDIMVYKMRLKYSENALTWQLGLGPLRAWTKYLLSCFGVCPAYATSDRMYYPAPMTRETPGGLPFAWHPGYVSFLIEENFTGQLPMVMRLVEELKSFESRGLSIKIVLVPPSLQVVAKDIDWPKVGSENRLAQDIPRITEMMEEIRAVGTEFFQKAGFEVLDMTDILQASPQRCLYFQPADTHCTALGYEVIGQAIASRWPELGRTHANRYPFVSTAQDHEKVSACSCQTIRTRCMPPHTLIAGLGNPGPKYERTRHNFGFMTVDALLEAGSFRQLSMGKDGVLFSLRLPGIEGEVLALKPMTFMNLSGQAVAQVLRYYKLGVENLVVVHDELDLPIGRMRMKQGGGLAGHNGLKSITADIGSQDFIRLRLGIGRPQGKMDVSNWVLQDFRPEEREVAKKVLPAAVAALRLYLNQGLEAAMREAGAFSALPLPEEEG